MEQSYVSDGYIELQKTIIDLEDKWFEEINEKSINQNINSDIRNKEIPVIIQIDMNMHVNVVKYKSWVKELANFLAQRDLKLKEDTNKLKENFNVEIANKWVIEAIACNDVYFTNYAKENNIATWVPQFIAEHAIRPYLKLVAEKYNDNFTNNEVKGLCPNCGEPIRLAQLEGEGQKIIHCPRCNAHWQEKRLKCSHCGNENHETLKFLSVENKITEQIYACNECKGYIKVIDTRELINKEKPAILDLKTIHLDYIAQQNGYGKDNDEAQTGKN